MSQDETSANPTPKPTDSHRKPKKRPRDDTKENAAAKKIKRSKKDRRVSTNGRTARHSDAANGGTHRDRAVQDLSAFRRERASLFITLSPIAYGNSLKGAIAEHISPLLLTYFPPLDGVILAFENAFLSSEPNTREDSGRPVMLGQSIDEYAVTYIWLTADFTILRPTPGTRLEGVVTVQNESMLGLICYNYFNATIERRQLPDSWKWIDDVDEEESTSGHYEDGSGTIVSGRVSFNVRDFEATLGDGGTGTINISGTLLDERRAPPDDQ